MQICFRCYDETAHEFDKYQIRKIETRCNKTARIKMAIALQTIFSSIKMRPFKFNRMQKNNNLKKKTGDKIAMRQFFRIFLAHRQILCYIGIVFVRFKCRCKVIPCGKN